MKYLTDLHAGRAGEHIAAAAVLAAGFDCFHAAQGMPYDLVMDAGGKLLRIQVKASRMPEKMPGRSINNLAYRFWVGRCGKDGRSSYTDNDVDLFAMVELDTKQVGFISVTQMVTTLFVRPESHRGTFTDEVDASRNAAILARLNAGADPGELAAEYGLGLPYISKIKHGRARSVRCGIYMADLTLEKALKSLEAGETSSLAGRLKKRDPGRHF